MSMLDFYIRVTKALDDIGAPYMIVGAFGGTIFGITRATDDVDIIVDLHDKGFEALSQKFPLPRYYADPEMIKNSVELGSCSISSTQAKGTKLISSPCSVNLITSLPLTVEYARHLLTKMTNHYSFDTSWA